MSLLTTGGTGFMGSNYIYHSLKSGIPYNIVDYSKETYAVHNRVLNDARNDLKFTSVDGDIADSNLLAKTIKKHAITYIVHFAASTHVDRSFRYPEEFVQTNIIGVFHLLEVLRRIKEPPILIHISTDETYGDVKKGVCDENTMLKPENPYASTKAATENLIHAWTSSYGLDIRIIRPTNNYGPRQHPEKLIAKIITRCLADRPYTLWKGNAIRNWLSVYDMCRAVDSVVLNGKKGESYNVSSSDDLTVDQVNSMLTKLLDKEYLFKGYEGQRLKLDQRYSLSSDKIKKLGWKQQDKFGEVIHRTIEWYEKNSWFWEGRWSQ